MNTSSPLFLAPQDSAAPAGGPSAALDSATAPEAPRRLKRHCISLHQAGRVQSMLAEITAAAWHAQVPRPTEIQPVLEAFIQLLMTKVTAGEKVLITNFATFKRRIVKARTHRNPKTDAPVTVAAHYKVYAETMPAFKEKLKAVPILAGPPSGSQVSAPLDSAIKH